jgi:hypothetical protein
MITFNEWREKYNEMTTDEQVAYHNYLETQYPEQAHYDLQFAKNVFELVKPKIVTEAGGWKGDLANEMFKVFDIKKWINIEICQNAIDNTKCKNDKFINLKPENFNWFNSVKIEGMFLATHFIEHLSNEHFIELANVLQKNEYIYFEAPLTNEGETWFDFHGTHKLEFGWNDIKNLFPLHNVILENNHCKLFKLK